MKRSRFTGSQIMEALKRVEAGLVVPELCRELGISTIGRIHPKTAAGHGCIALLLLSTVKNGEITIDRR